MVNCVCGVGGNGMLGGTIVIVWGFLLLPDESFCLPLGAAQIHEPRFLFKERKINFILENSLTIKMTFNLHFAIEESNNDKENQNDSSSDPNPDSGSAGLSSG